MTRPITPQEAAQVDELVARGRAALQAFEGATQEQVDRLCRAVAWAVANEQTFARLARMGVEESGIGDPESRVGKRFKIMGILRDVLRQKSIGVIEELPEKGIVKYGKPVGLIASLVPTTNPELTPPGVALFAIKCRDAVIFSPHPRSKNTTRETVEIMRRVLAREGAPIDLLQCLERPSIPAAQYLMTRVDLVQATGGRDMVRAAYSSGTPAYGVGAGNSTMVIDETADVVEAARNTRISKTSDFGSGCSADGNLIVEASVYEALRDRLVAEGGHLATAEEAAKLRAVLWDAEGRRTPDTIAISAQKLAEKAGFQVAPDRRFFIVEQVEIGRGNPFSSEKLGVVLAMFRYSGFDEALEMVRAIFEVGGKGHSCGIYSFDDDHIDRLARVAPVSRIMVRQPQSKANAGAFNNGMPMTSSLGCGTWGGNITSENIHLKHYMNTTWVSRPIPEDRPSEQELFGEFYGRPVD
ncbi:MAG: aldehyde dehydrogenase family protein [Armatimonadota bacterium]|nr:aldehyde dehydrogenase family protein [Armatimonadota bacterium]MDR7420981.1 aldehyde dehydrogenase family protein [Armatimonadota bacterium]MDR7455513.1 aldehyde dehydrogenase family protein [Armatimonadota bacterium]MDR7497408.1 aldehyde dehydrogenase family protein [Armatimonadota bacterium]MDR7511895.1 aldehyde dehydrogenase family protein [Armatimonadota bacterium]